MCDDGEVGGEVGASSPALSCLKTLFQGVLETCGVSSVSVKSENQAPTITQTSWQHGRDVCSGFVCQQDSHIVAIRKIFDLWWEFDSYGSPRTLSSFHLSALLDAYKRRGYRVLHIIGRLPKLSPSVNALALEPTQRIRGLHKLLQTTTTHISPQDRPDNKDQTSQDQHMQIDQQHQSATPHSDDGETETETEAEYDPATQEAIARSYREQSLERYMDSAVKI